MKYCVTIYFSDNSELPDHEKYEMDSHKEGENVIQKALETYVSEIGESEIAEVDIRNALLEEFCH